MKIYKNEKIDFDDVLIIPKSNKLNSRKDVKLSRTIQFKYSKEIWTGTPIIAANIDGVGTVSMHNTLSGFGMMTCLVKNYLRHFEKIRNATNELITITTGVQEEDLKWLDTFMSLYPLTPTICIDIANGYIEKLKDTIKLVRKKYPYVTIIAGNVVTKEETKKLIKAGADVVKVGIGPGSLCTTRIKTGVGYPQISAIAECAKVAHKMKAHIVADGGCKNPGDIAKAFVAGADFVMLGGLLAGHKQSEIKPVNGKIKAYGMSSFEAMKRNYNSINDYRTSEGREVEIAYKGDVSNTIKDILGGLASTCTYIGAKEISEMPKKGSFVKTKHQYNRMFE